jgi:hypothetical protein
VMQPGSPSLVEAGLDFLAAVELRTAGAQPRPPADPAICVLVTARGTQGNWGDVIDVAAESAQ